MLVKVMEMDKLVDLRKKSEVELHSLILVLKKEIFTARMSNNVTVGVRYIKRQIGRILTLLNERKKQKK